MKKLMMLVAVAMLAGCGSDGSSSTVDQPPPAYTDNGVDAGVYVSSTRNAHRDWTVATSKGTFSTYSSYMGPIGTPVKIYPAVDYITGLECKRLWSTNAVFWIKDQYVKTTIQINKILTLTE